MKLKIVILSMIFALTISCSNYLNEEIVSGVGYSYLKTASGIEAGVGATYASLRWDYSGENMHAIQELGTDTYMEGQDGGYKPALNRYESSLNSQFSLLYDFWANYYKGISRANTVLLSITDVTGMTDEMKKVRTGEVKFLRSLFYFKLVQTFGKVPIVDASSIEAKTDFKRSSVADVYKLIISDLRDAVAKLTETQTDYGRATKYAACHLLGSVYLTRASAVTELRGQQPTDLDSAAIYADQVITSNKYALVSDFKQLWSIDNQKNSEIIFAVQYSTNMLYNNDLGNKIHLYYTMVYDNKPGMTRDIENGRPWRRVRPTDFSLFELYDRKNDSRFYKTFKTVWLCNYTGNIPKWEAKAGFVPSPELLGKPKLKLGDTAIWVTMEKYSAKTKMDSLFASRPYYYIPRNRQTNAEFPQNYKFYDNKRPSVAEENGSRDWKLFRLAETYLIAAEAYGRKGDFDNAVKRLNVVRERAAYKEGELKPSEFTKIDGGVSADRTKTTLPQMLLTKEDITTRLGGKSFVDFMLDERAREMHGELVRKWDLMRCEKLYERVKKYNPEAVNVQPYHQLMPIPQNHIDRLEPAGVIGEEQNPGYY